jgi:ATP-dependent DNA helicase DinG
MPFPNSKCPGYIAAITAEIERLILASHGHAAVLFTSYDAMGRIYAALSAKRLPFPLYRLERSNSKAIEQFKQSAGGVLFASGAMWEGVDIPGDALSMLIIVKLPFAVPDPIGEYEQTLYADMFEYKNRVIVPEMLIKLKQGFGRLIRKETDTGVVAILDSRVSGSGAYRARVLNALPDCRVTAEISDVKNFIEMKKAPAYFG